MATSQLSGSGLEERTPSSLTELPPVSRQRCTGSQTPKTLGSFSIIRVIGEGGHSRAYLAQDKSSGRPVVLKQIAKSGLVSVKLANRAFLEKDILSKIRHPMIVGFYDSFQDPENLYMELEFVQGGDLYTWMVRKGKLKPFEVKFYAAEIAAVLHYLHQQGIVYRDLKHENVLISATGHIKLADFGLAKRQHHGERTFSLCGTPHFMAPEVITRRGHGFAVDWWSLGILLHEVLTLTSPFEASTAYEVYSSIMTKEFRPPEGLDPDTSSLLVGLVNKDPGCRLKGEEVLRHPFFKGVDWSHLETLTPPHIPVVKNPFDTCHFDNYELNPTRSTRNAQVDQTQFAGF